MYGQLVKRSVGLVWDPRSTEDRGQIYTFNIAVMSRLAEGGSDLYRRFQRHVSRLSNRMEVTGGVRAWDEVSALEQALA